MASSEDSNSTIHSSKEEDADTTDPSHSNSSECNKESSPGLPSTTDESNDLTVSASDVSSKCDSQQDLGATEKTTDSTRIVGKKKERPKVKVVASRYKASASTARSNNSSSSTQGNNTSGSSSSHSQSKSLLNETQKGPPANKRHVQRSKAIRSRLEEVCKPGLPSKLSIPNTRPGASQYAGQRQGAGTHSSKPKTTKPGASKPSKSATSDDGSKAVLHSTAINTTLMTDMASGKNNNMLSSTFLTGVTPGGYKPNSSSRVLMELPDISVIKPEGNSSGNRTVLSSVSEEGPPSDCDATTIVNVTPEHLELEYMKYLQWAYVDIISQKTFGNQLKEMQNQIVFLEQLVNEKQEEVSETRRKTDIINHHKRVSDAYDMQMKLLQTLAGDLPACEEAQKVMEKELEKKLHQIKMENVYIPQDHTKYRDELSEALNTQLSLLQELEDIMEPQEQQRNSTITLLSDLQNVTDRVLRCEKEMQQAAGVAVEEASHQLGAKQMTPIPQ